ncbi:MAG: trehalose-phosphatase [Caldilineaceae bacterium]|nr:trehalose-phosphatase [Caldilineaceae bacterium]
MSTKIKQRALDELPHVLHDPDTFARRLAGRTPALFLDYDGTLTPIVDRPEDAVIAPSMRQAVADLAQRCPVCVVSGRDRRTVQRLMGINDLIVAGSHGFDIWSPDDGHIEHAVGEEFGELMASVKQHVSAALADVDGAIVEPKAASVAVHYRLASAEGRRRIAAVVEDVLARHPNQLKQTPGKMVYEIQPQIDWDKGKAVHYLLDALDLNLEEIVPLYLGDDTTDEDAFQALSGHGIGIFVGALDDPEIAGRTSAADFILYNVDEVERFLRELDVEAD